MKVSIIIRTRNEGKTLPGVLNKIKGQVFEGETEIIVVDSGSTDNTLVCAREAGCRIIEVEETDFTFGRAINEGVKKAVGDFIVLLSGHTVPVNEIWLRELITAFTGERIVAVFGRQVPIRGYDPFEEWQFHRNFPSKITKLTKIALWGDTFSNASCAIRRNILLKYPFDESLSGSEDREWAGRVKRNGFEIRYTPVSKVIHSHPLSYRAVYERKFIQAKARQSVYPGTCRYDNIFWIFGAVITTVLIDVLYCVCRGYFMFLPKIFPYRYYYFRGLIDGVKEAKDEK